MYLYCIRDNHDNHYNIWITLEKHDNPNNIRNYSEAFVIASGNSKDLAWINAGKVLNDAKEFAWHQINNIITSY